MAIRRQLGQRYPAAIALLTLGRVLVSLGELDQAEQALDEALAVLREVGDLGQMAIALLIISAIAARRGLDQRAAVLKARPIGSGVGRARAVRPCGTSGPRTSRQPIPGTGLRPRPPGSHGDRRPRGSRRDPAKDARALPARDPGRRIGGGGAQQPQDRRRATPLRAHGRDPRSAHPEQAGLSFPEPDRGLGRGANGGIRLIP